MALLQYAVNNTAYCTLSLSLLVQLPQIPVRIGEVDLGYAIEADLLVERDFFGRQECL